MDFGGFYMQMSYSPLNFNKTAHSTEFILSYSKIPSSKLFYYYTRDIDYIFVFKFLF